MIQHSMPFHKIPRTDHRNDFADRCKAVVPVLFLIMCSFLVYTTGRLMYLGLLVLFVLFSPFVLAFWSPRLGKRELVFVLLVHLFVFLRVCFCPFSLALWFGSWLQFVIVAYPGPFYFLIWIVGYFVTIGAGFLWKYQWPPGKKLDYLNSLSSRLATSLKTKRFTSFGRWALCTTLTSTSMVTTYIWVLKDFSNGIARHNYIGHHGDLS